MTDSAASDAAASDERSRVPPASRTPAGSPKPGPPARGLSTEQVMAAALHLVDTEGLSALSMRRLARAVDREAMTLYRYAASKTSLLDGITDLVLRGLDVNPRAADWRQELRKLADDFRAMALAHPNVVPLLLTRPLATPPGRRLPGTLRPLEDFLELFTGAGFTPCRRAARLPAVLRLPARTRPARTTRTHRQPRRDRRPAAPRPAPPAPGTVPPATRPRQRTRRLRRRRPTPPRSRDDDHRAAVTLQTSQQPDPASAVAAVVRTWGSGVGAAWPGRRCATGERTPRSGTPRGSGRGTRGAPSSNRLRRPRPAAVQKTSSLEVPMHLRTEGELTISDCGSVKPSVRTDQVRPLRVI